MHITPASSQPPLPLDRLIVSDAPDPEAIEMDVVIVGAGPAGLATAIELARLAKAAGREDLQVAVLEKATALGEHNLSGAVVNPRSLRELFPDLADADFPFRQAVSSERVYFLTESRAQRIPAPPTMRNAGFFTASISELCRWMGERAEELGGSVEPQGQVVSVPSPDFVSWASVSASASVRSVSQFVASKAPGSLPDRRFPRQTRSGSCA